MSKNREQEKVGLDPRYLDAGIRDVTMALWTAGFLTTWSAEPGLGKGVEHPTVLVAPQPGASLEETRVAVASFLLQARYRNFSSGFDVVHGLEAPPDPSPRDGSVKIEFFDSAPIQPYPESECVAKLTGTALRLQTALDFYNAGLTADAISEWSAILQHEPTCIEAEAHLEQALAEQRVVLDELQQLSESIVQSPRDAAAHYRKAHLLWELGRYEEACASWQTVTQIGSRTWAKRARRMLDKHSWWLQVSRTIKSPQVEP